MIVIVVALEVLVIIFLFFLFKGKNYLSVAIMENTLRVRLVFILLVFLPLLFLITLYIGEIGKPPAYIYIIDVIRAAKAEQKLLMILTHVFLLIALLTIPFMTLFHLCFGYRRFIRFLRKHRNYANKSTVKSLKSIVREVTNSSKIDTKPELVVVQKDVAESIPGFAGCGIVGKGKNDLALLVSEDFVSLFRRDILSRKEVEAVFLHELSHVLHQDYFIPLWARSFVPSRAFVIATLCCSLAVFFGILRTGLSGTNLMVLIFVLVGMYLFRAIMMQVTAHVIRQREHLADTRAALLHNHSAELVEALKKMYLYMMPARSIFPVSQFMDRFATHGEDEYIEIAHNFKEAFLGVKQRFRDFFLFRVSWYSRISSRIRAIKEEKNVMIDIGDFLSPLSMVGLCFLAASCSFVVSASLTFLGAGHGFRRDFSFLLSYTIATVLIFLSCLPLKFAQTEVLRKALIPNSWKHLPLHYFISRFWGNLHVNNLFVFTASMLCLTMNGLFIDIRDGLVLFFVYTVLTMLFVTMIHGVGTKKEGIHETPIIRRDSRLSGR